MNLFCRKRQMVIICAALLLTAGFVLLRYLPLRKQTKNMHQELSSRKLTIDRTVQSRAKLEKLNEKLVELQIKTADFEENVPQQKDIGLLLNSITELMNKQHLADQLIQPGVQINGDSLNCIPVKICGQGKLNQIFEFFRSLETFKRLVRIENVRLSNDKDFNGNLRMVTNALVYYRAQKQHNKTDSAVN